MHYEKYLDISYFSTESQSILGEYICPLCQGVYYSPMIDKCGHVFCNPCITAFYSNGLTLCPISNESIDITTTTSIKFIAGILAKQILRCKNIDCNWIGKLSDLEEHLGNQCLKQKILCSNLDCKHLCLREDIAEHLVVCEYQMVNCQHCFIETSIHSMNKHLETCDKLKVDCPQKCSMLVEREKLELHMAKECDNLPVNCMFNNYGCVDKIFKKEKDIHLKDNMDSHNILLLGSFNEFKKKVNDRLNDFEDLFNKVAAKVTNFEKIVRIEIEEETANLFNQSQTVKYTNEKSLNKNIKDNTNCKNLNRINNTSQEKEEKSNTIAQNNNINTIPNNTDSNDGQDGFEALADVIKKVEKVQKESSHITEDLANIMKKTKEKRKDIDKVKDKKMLFKKRLRDDDSNTNIEKILTNENESKKSIKDKEFILNTKKDKERKKTKETKQELDNKKETDKTPSKDPTIDTIVNEPTCPVSPNNKKEKSNDYSSIMVENSISNTSKSLALDFISKKKQSKKTKENKHPKSLINVNNSNSSNDEEKFLIDTVTISKNLQVEKNKVTCSNSSTMNEHKFVFLQTNLNNKDFSWKVTIKKLKKWIGIGVCFKELVVLNGYKFIGANPSQFKNGVCCVSSNGFSWHSENSIQNNTSISNFPGITQGTTIEMTYKYESCKLIFKIGNWEYKLKKVSPLFETSLVPCVILLNDQDEIVFEN